MGPTPAGGACERRDNPGLRTRGSAMVGTSRARRQAPARFLPAHRMNGGTAGIVAPREKGHRGVARTVTARTTPDTGEAIVRLSDPANLAQLSRTACALAETSHPTIEITDEPLRLKLRHSILSKNSRNFIKESSTDKLLSACVIETLHLREIQHYVHVDLLFPAGKT